MMEPPEAVAFPNVQVPALVTTLPLVLGFRIVPSGEAFSATTGEVAHKKNAKRKATAKRPPLCKIACSIKILATNDSI
jgi:hypothetical protein